MVHLFDRQTLKRKGFSMASNNESVAVATWRDYDPDAAAKAAEQPAKPAAKAAADKKEN